MHTQPLNDYLLLLATGLFLWHARHHHPVHLETWMKRKVARNKGEFKYMKQFPGSHGSPLSPLPWCKRYSGGRSTSMPSCWNSPAARCQPGVKVQGLRCPRAGNFLPRLHGAVAALALTRHRLGGPNNRAAARAGTGSPAREGIGANHLKLPGLLCAQSCLWCLELFAKWLQNMEPAVWLTEWLNVPGELEENPEHQTAATVLLITMTHQMSCLNVGGKWEWASAPSYIIFSSYSPVAHPHLCTVALYLVQRKLLTTLTHKKIL